MEKVNKNIFRNQKFFLIFSLFFIFLFLNLNSVSAAALWTYKLNDINMVFNSHITGNIKSFCTDCTYFWITFRNPDNLVQTYFLKSSDNKKLSNSYFDFKLSSNGQVDFWTKNKAMNKNTDTQFSVYASNNGNTPQVYQYFYLRIRGNNADGSSGIKPSLSVKLEESIQIEGNNTWSSNIINSFVQAPPQTPTNYFLHITEHPTIKDFILNTITNKECWTGTSVTICMDKGGNYEIKGNNKTSSSTLYIQIRATNEWGEAISAPVYIHSVPTVTLNYTTTVPFRSFDTLIPLEIDFNETKGVILDNIWSNFLYINATITADNGTNITLTGNPNVPLQSILQKSNFTAFVTYNGLFIKSNYTPTTFNVWLSACNLAGCDTTANIQNVIIQGSVPEQTYGDVDTPITIVLEYNQFKALDFNNHFNNLTEIRINWSDDITVYNYSLSTPNGTDLNKSSQIQATIPVQLPNKLEYEIDISWNNIIQFTSVRTDFNFIINTTACNLAGCVRGPPIYFYISGAKNPELISQINSTLWTNIASTFLDLYPENDGLSNGQKGAIVVISLFIVSFIFLILTMNMDMEASTKMYSLLFINSLVGIFLMLKGYVPTIVPILISLGLLILIFIKIIGGKN